MDESRRDRPADVAQEVVRLGCNLLSALHREAHALLRGPASAGGQAPRLFFETGLCNAKYFVAGSKWEVGVAPAHVAFQAQSPLGAVRFQWSAANADTAAHGDPAADTPLAEAGR